ncbi:MAG: M16 family metallopeptidase, partial [Candidatus Kariarchaeaceae archaeon]
MADFEVRKLKNGVPVLLVSYKDGETATIGISYNVGGRNEWKRGKSMDGISHFLEHQFFKGAPPLSSKIINERLDDLGGLDNAFTTEDTTCYFAKVLRSEIYNAIDLWSDLLVFGEISQKEFDNEAFVVKQEFRRFEDNPPFLLQVTLQKELFKGTSLEMDVIGNVESLSTVTLRQMEIYRNKHYGLENAVLMVLGNFDTEEVFAKLEETFGKRVVSPKKPRYELTSFEKPSKSSLKLISIEKDTPLIFFGLAIKTPGGSSKFAPALEILSAYLSMGKSSLIQKQLVRPGISAFAFAFTQLWEDVGQLMFVAGTPGPNYEQAHETSIKMLYEALTAEITPQLLEKICDRIEFSIRSNSEEPMDILFEQSTGYWRRGRFISME